VPEVQRVLEVLGPGVLAVLAVRRVLAVPAVQRVLEVLGPGVLAVLAVQRVLEMLVPWVLWVLWVLWVPRPTVSRILSAWRGRLQARRVRLPEPSKALDTCGTISPTSTSTSRT
jgi:hypothetical protein